MCILELFVYNYVVTVYVMCDWARQNLASTHEYIGYAVAAIPSILFAVFLILLIRHCLTLAYY